MATTGVEVKRITALELAEGLQRGDPIVVLDVRRREAWASNPERIPGATWLPLEELPQRAKDMSPDTRIVLYCS